MSFVALFAAHSGGKKYSNIELRSPETANFDEWVDGASLDSKSRTLLFNWMNVN